MINRHPAAEARDRMLKLIEEVLNFLQRMTNEPHDSNGRLHVLEEMAGDLKDAGEALRKTLI